MSRCLCWCALVAGLLLAAAAPAQERPPNFGQGSHGLRAILKQKFKLEPIDLGAFPWYRSNEPEALLIVVLGDTDFLNRVGGRELLEFVQRGGALLVASDLRSGRGLERAFGVEITGDFLVAREGSASAWRGLTEYPLLGKETNWRHPIFRNVRTVAANRPSHLAGRGNRRLPTLARFPGDVFWEGGRGGVGSEWEFAAGAQVQDGKALVLADHSVFINDMLVQADNDNFFFACNVVDWLTDGGKRKYVLFLENDKPVMDFSATLKEPELPPIPLPPEGVLIEKGNEIIAAVDAADPFNQFLNERVPQVAVLRTLLLLLSLMVLVLVVMRLLRARHRIAATEPLLALCLAEQAPGRPLLARRHEDMRRQDNHWESAHQMARQLFETLPRPAGSGDAWPQEAPLKFQGGWWQRRQRRQQVERLWRLALGQAPERITTRDFQRLQDDLRQVRTALANGTVTAASP